MCIRDRQCANAHHEHHRVLDLLARGELAHGVQRGVAQVIVPAAQFADVRLLEWAVFETLDAVTKRKLMGYCPGTPEGLLTQPDLR